jgi:hypothetical protein
LVSILPVCDFSRQIASRQIARMLEPVARGFGLTVPLPCSSGLWRPECHPGDRMGVLVVDRLWLLHRAEWPMSARAVEWLREKLS